MCVAAMIGPYGNHIVNATAAAVYLPLGAPNICLTREFAWRMQPIALYGGLTMKVE
jgi:hypothetical protein